MVNRLIIFLLFLFYFGCSTPRRAERAESQQSTYNNVPTEPQTEYAGISLRYGVGIMAFDQASRWDSLLAPTTSSFFAKAVSPQGDKLALAYRGTNSLKVCLITFNPIKLTPVNSSEKATSVAFAWNTNDSILYFNYYGLQEIDRRTYTRNLGSYYVNANSMQLNYLKFRNGSAIKGYLPNGFLVSSYGDETYLISLRTGMPVHILRGLGPLTFSPNGKNFFYFRDRTFLNEYGNEVRLPELYLADFNGWHRRMIIGYKYDPQNPVWSPDSKTIALDVQSQQWSNIRDLAFYDVETGMLSVQGSNLQVNVPSVTEPHYSPDGRYLFYYVTTGDLSVYPYYEEVDAVVKDLRFGSTQVINRGSIPGNPVGGFVRWFDGNNLGLSATGWMAVFNVSKGTRTNFSDYPLHVQESQ